MGAMQSTIAWTRARGVKYWLLKLVLRLGENQVKRAGRLAQFALGVAVSEHSNRKRN
jgi:hypothetical protein